MPKREGKWWFLLVWQDDFKEGGNQRRRKRIKLAPASMPVREVNKIAAEALWPLNQRLQTIGSATRFQDFITEVYKQIVIPLMAASTQGRYEGGSQELPDPCRWRAVLEGYHCAFGAAVFFRHGVFRS